MKIIQDGNDFISVKECCMNCEYFWVDPDASFCRIDEEIVPEPLEEIKFCPAFELWWGAVE